MRSAYSHHADSKCSFDSSLNEAIGHLNPNGLTLPTVRSAQ